MPSDRLVADAWLTHRIHEIHEERRGTYGAPRVQAELQDEGWTVGLNRVVRLMREAGLQGVSRRNRTVTTTHGNDRRPAPDLVEHDFAVCGPPDRLWVADITYVPTWADFLYLAVVVDAWSRRVVGWAMGTHLQTDLVLDALNLAVSQRWPEEVIHHTDQGTQYISLAFGKRCQETDIRTSMGSVGDAYDNSLCDSFFGTLECELIGRRTFRTYAEARMVSFDFNEGFYDPRRRHSALDYLSPVSCEEEDLSAA